MKRRPRRDRRTQLILVRGCGILAAVAVVNLFEHLEIDWPALRGPEVDRREARPAWGSRPAGRPTSPGPVRDDDLRSVASLEALQGQAVALGLLASSEAGFLGFLATASYCLRVGTRPAALFVHFVRRGRYPATLEDEDRALAALRRERSAGPGVRRWLEARSPG